MIIGLTFLLCVIVHTLAPFASLRIIPGFSSLSLPIRQSWYHRLVSSLHALVMSSLVVRYWGRVNINLAVSDAIGPLQKTSLDVMVGFLFYGILFESLLSKSYDTAMYYLVGLVIHLLTRYSDSGVSMYHLMALYLSELSTPCCTSPGCSSTSVTIRHLSSTSSRGCFSLCSSCADYS